MKIKFGCVNIVATVADAPWIIPPFIDELRRLIVYYNDKKPIVSVDIKFDPNATSNLHYKAAATLQICYRTHCIIIQLLHLDVTPPALLAFLVDTKIEFVSYKVSDSASKLQRSYGICSRVPIWLASYSSIDLAQRVRTDLGLNIEIPTGASSSACGARNLTEEQTAICAYAVGMLGVKYYRGSF
ncbi:uncharacterized protein LOC113324908 [Papaver somniferum]|uniref:uncharacterized protein LOC113324908 n=1 Tax=Papaver somniferum TaxID=3469 RepID=UPI000E6FBC17|nr:uncharacterized protein LOC113324908 [Papaver somniferum]